MALHSVEEIMELASDAVWSCCIANERNPASLLIVAQPESGKSDIIATYSQNPYIIMVTDMTAYGLIRTVMPKVAEGKVRLILIPDLTNSLSRNRDTVASFLSALAAFMEEGVTNITTKFISIEYPQPLRGGVITSMTPGELARRRKYWAQSGFLSRFLVLSYTYSNGTQHDIRTYLWQRSGRTRTEEAHLGLPLEKQDVRLPSTFLPRLEELVQQYVAALGLHQDAYGFRVQGHLQRLILGATLREHKQIATPEIIDRVCYLFQRYANLSYNEAR